MITVSVNNSPQKTEKETTVLQLLKNNGISQTKGVAVAINNNVLLKSKWETEQLMEGDLVTIITATAGG